MSRSVETLFAAALAKYGRQVDLARAMGVTHATLHGMLTGHRPVSPETVAELCALVGVPGDEARRLVALSIIENPKNKKRAGSLRSALFRCWAAGAAALLAYLGAGWISPTQARTVNPLYIVAHCRRTVPALG